MAELSSAHWAATLPGREQKDRMPPSVKYWEIIADNLSKARWNWGSISAIDSNGRTIWIADAHRGDGKRFVSDAEEKLRAFLELESAIRAAECPEDCEGREIKLDTLSRGW